MAANEGSTNAPTERRPLPEVPRLTHWERERICIGVEAGLIVADDLGLAVAVMPDVRTAEERAAHGDPWPRLSHHGDFGTLSNEVTVLSRLLLIEGAQSVALGAMGVELEEVPLQTSLLASRAAAELRAIAAGFAPFTVTERNEEVLTLLLHQTEGHTFDPWMAMIEPAILGVLGLCRNKDGEPEESTPFGATAAQRGFAGLVLDAVEQMTGDYDLPEPFITRDDEHMRAAEKCLREVRIRELGAESQPKMKARKGSHQRERQGPTKLAWTAAQEFAECFGVSLPNKSDRKRRPGIKTRSKALCARCGDKVRSPG